MSDALISALKGSEKSVRALLDRKLKTAEKARDKAKAKVQEFEAKHAERVRAADEIRQAIASLTPPPAA